MGRNRSASHGLCLILRLGLRPIDGFREDWAKALSTARAAATFADIETLARRAELPAAAMRKLADADAFRSLGQDRREALWAVRRLPDNDPLPLFATAEARERGARELGAEPDAHPPAVRASTRQQRTLLSERRV